MEKKKIWKDERVQAGVLVLAAFLLLTAWAFMQPLGAGPDEKMRYMVAQYLHEHPGKLPLGDEPTIRDATWGISYAYYPILSYMVSAVPCICRRITPCGEDGRCALCDWSGIFCGESIRKAFSERRKMAVCRTGRLYAAGIVSGDLCKYGFPGTFIHGDAPVFLVLLSGSGRLEFQKFDPSGCWNGSLCTVLL